MELLFFPVLTVTTVDFKLRNPSSSLFFLIIVGARNLNPDTARFVARKIAVMMMLSSYYHASSCIVTALPPYVIPFAALVGSWPSALYQNVQPAPQLHHLCNHRRPTYPVAPLATTPSPAPDRAPFRAITPLHATIRTVMLTTSRFAYILHSSHHPPARSMPCPIAVLESLRPSKGEPFRNPPLN